VRAAAAHAVLVLLVGCRIHFDAIDADADAGSGSLSDGRAADTTGSGTNGLMISFGERTTSMHKGVTDDTYVDASVPALNFGVDPELSIAATPAPPENTLIRFDLSALAPTTLIASATLEVVHVSTSDEVLGSISVFSVAESWVGGTGLGSVSVANWNQRLTSTAWTIAGGTAGLAVAPAGVPTSSTSITLDPLVVQGWISAPATNLGLMIRATTPSSGTHYHFHSSNSASVDLRPELVIELVN
jgi:hypothetical protein